MKKIFTLLLSMFIVLPMMADDETVTITSPDSLGSNKTYTFTQNGVTVSTSKGAQQYTYFGCNAGETITFSASKNISAISVNGYVKKGFTATVDNGTVSYEDATDSEITADPVVSVTSINATSCTISCAKQLRCYSVTVYFSGTPDVVAGGGSSSSDYTFDYEPTTASDLTITFDSLFVYDYTDESGNTTGKELYFSSDDYEMDMVAYVNADATNGITPGTYQIASTNAANTVLASPGGDDYYDYPTYIATDFEYDDTYGWYYNTTYYVESGTLTVESTTAGPKYTLNAKSHYGSTITATYVGQPVDETTSESGDDSDDDSEDTGDYTFDYEPTTASDLTITFDSLSVVDYTEAMGYQCTDLYFTCDDYEMELIAFAQNDATYGIAPGTYEISSSYEDGTLQASPGGDDYYDYPSYVITGFEYDETYESWYYTTTYYMVSGTLTVAADAAGTKYTLNAKSYYGSTINATYTGKPDVEVYDAISNVESDGQTSNAAQKVLKNNRILIHKDGKTYNVQGIRLVKQD